MSLRLPSGSDSKESLGSGQCAGNLGSVPAGKISGGGWLNSLQVIQAWRIHGQTSLCASPWNLKESDMTILLTYTRALDRKIKRSLN